MADINEKEIVKSSTVTDGLSPGSGGNSKNNQIEKLKELRLLTFADKTRVNYLFIF